MRGWLIVGLFIALCLALYYELKASDDLSASAPLVTSPPVLVKNCAPSHSICAVQFGPITLDVQLQPAGLPSMVPLTLRVRSKFLDDVRVMRAWFEGRDMDMGRHEMARLPDDAASDAIMWRGVIPVCSVNPQMVWQLKLLLLVQDEQRLIVFDLATNAINK